MLNGGTHTIIGLCRSTLKDKESRHFTYKKSFLSEPSLSLFDGKLRPKVKIFLFAALCLDGRQRL